MSPNLLARIRSKPAKVVVARAAQEFLIRGSDASGYWPLLARRSRRHWSRERGAELIGALDRNILVATDCLAALQWASEHELLDPDPLARAGEEAARRQFTVFGAQVPPEGPLPWDADWRFDKTWPKSRSRSFDLYAPRENPHDVKFPWELSRLAFVVRIVAAAAIRRDETLLRAAAGILEDWERRNPVGQTVAWDPMECSMRVIAIVLVLEMARLISRDAGLGAICGRLLTTHGAFIRRTVEYTDVRGNHYTANLVALLLGGLALASGYKPAAAWARYAQRRLDREVLLQFTPDGVNFEKSTDYHRLVTELFLIADLALSRRGDRLSPAARERLSGAVRYSATYTRPDGTAPIIGDSDDAIALPLEVVSARDHRPLIGWGAVWFQDAPLKASAGAMPARIAWLAGCEGVRRWGEMHAAGPDFGVEFFPDGGAVAGRTATRWFWMDVGDVGMNGRGGHGHNDLLSFEWFDAGQPVIVDPGSYMYSGDLAARDLFRSTFYHNTIQVDGEEIAPLQAAFRIGPHARPIDVAVDADDDRITVSAGHTGYRRLADPVTVRRSLAFDRRTALLECRDTVECRSTHRVARLLHFASHLNCTIRGNTARLAGADAEWLISWPAGGEAELLDAWTSAGYAQRVPATMLRLTENVAGTTDLSFTIARL